MNRKQSIALITTAYSAITHIQDGWVTVAERLFDAALKSEKEHRAHRSGFGISAQVAAKLFTVKYLAQSLERPDRYTADDIISIRLEVLYAQAYAKKYAVEIREAWAKAGVFTSALKELDYAELMN